jgi:prolyl-tRNA editing enzyme YbaK/EbsC (Cys-tRNA(Pro) deacylase)
MRTLAGRDLLRSDEIWAAAGSPRAVFALTPARLVELTRGEIVDVRTAPEDVSAPRR